VQDHELIEKIKAGDSHAFKKLFKHYNSLVINICYKLVGNKEEAEDLSQEVFFKVYKSAKSFKHRSKFSTWIYRIAVNLSLNHLRKIKQASWLSLDISSKQTDGETLDTLPAPSGDQPDVFLEQKEKEIIIWKMINLLPENQRVALILQRYEGMSCQEIADILECSIGTVQARLHRARENLHKPLSLYLKEI